MAALAALSLGACAARPPPLRPSPTLPATWHAVAQMHDAANGVVASGGPLVVLIDDGVARATWLPTQFVAFDAAIWCDQRWVLAHDASVGASALLVWRDDGWRDVLRVTDRLLGDVLVGQAGEDLFLLDEYGGVGRRMTCDDGEVRSSAFSLTQAAIQPDSPFDRHRAVSRSELRNYLKRAPERYWHPVPRAAYSWNDVLLWRSVSERLWQVESTLSLSQDLSSAAAPAVVTRTVRVNWLLSGTTAFRRPSAQVDLLRVESPAAFDGAWSSDTKGMALGRADLPGSIVPNPLGERYVTHSGGISRVRASAAGDCLDATWDLSPMSSVWPDGLDAPGAKLELMMPLLLSDQGERLRVISRAPPSHLLVYGYGEAGSAQFFPLKEGQPVSASLVAPVPRPRPSVAGLALTACAEE